MKNLREHSHLTPESVEDLAAELADERDHVNAVSEAIQGGDNEEDTAALEEELAELLAEQKIKEFEPLPVFPAVPISPPSILQGGGRAQQEEKKAILNA